MITHVEIFEEFITLNTFPPHIISSSGVRVGRIKQEMASRFVKPVIGGYIMVMGANRAGNIWSGYLKNMSAKNILDGQKF